MSIEINITDNIVEVTPTEQQVDINITENPIEVNVTDQIISISQTGLQGPQGPAGPGVPMGGTSGQILAKNSSTNYDTLWINNAVGTVTSINASGVSGISVSGGPITSSGTLLITNTAPDQIVSLTGTGTTSISGTYPSFTINSADQYSGTVTSVNMSVPTGLTISGNPITSSGTLAIGLASGYSIPTTANQTNWNTAYNDSIVSAAVTGTTTKTLTLNQQDGGTVTASWTDINTDAVTSVFGRTGAVVAAEGDYTLTQLGDVTITTPSTNQVLKYNGTAWVNSADTDTGITSLNGLTALTQTFATGTSGSDFNISSGTSTHTFNLPTASATNRGLLSSANWTTFNNKVGGSGTSGQIAYWNGTATQTGSADFTWDNTNKYLTANIGLSGYVKLAQTGWNSGFIQTAYSNFIFGSNLRYDGTEWKYDQSGYGAQFQADSFNGYIQLNTSVSGSAGATATILPRFRILNDGRTLLGQTLPTDDTTTILQVQGTGRFTSSLTANSFVKSGGTSLQYLMADGSVSTLPNISNWNTAYNDSIVSAAVTGTTTKTLTLTQQDAGTITASWTDINTDAVTSVFGRTGAVVAAEGDYTLTQLGDVTITTPSIGQVLKYNGSSWVNNGDAGLTSVGLSMPVAFSVANTPLTSNGTLAVTAVGTSAQYIRGDGQLATLPSGSSGGSSVNYYLNGSINQGTIGGSVYYEMNRNAIIGVGTDFTRTNASGNGLIAQFITDAGDPNRLEIPGGAWNFEMYFSASSSGGSPTFYVELLKYDGTTFTSIASNVSNPEVITGGTLIDLYVSSLAVSQTTLLVTDRLAIRVYITTSGKDITLHTEDNHLCEIVTTFAGGVSSLNGLTANTQYFAVGTSGTDFAISSVSDTHTFNLPTASATNRGALSSTDWTSFNNKQNALTNPVTGTGTTNEISYWTSGSSIGSLTITTYPSLTELSYVKGVTSSIQTQINSKFTLPSLTSGSVLFSNGTTIVQDNANFFWDDTNNRLGLGNAAPTTTLDIIGTFKVSGTATLSSSLNVTGVSTFSDITGIGGVVTQNNLNISRAIVGAVTANGIQITSQVGSSVTTAARYYSAIASTAAGFTLPDLFYYRAAQSTFSGTVTNQYGYYVDATMIGATNNYGFFSNLAVSGTSRWNLYLGTAPNQIQGSVVIGINQGDLGYVNLRMAKNLTGGTVAIGISNAGFAQSDVTSVWNYASASSTQATAFALTNYIHYRAEAGTIGAGSSITNQTGYQVASTMTTATNNYGFRGLLPAATGRWNLYMDGTAINHINGALLLGGTTDNGVDKLQVTGSATLSSSVTASSLIKSGGTSAQILAADGSVITAGTNVTISGGTISASGGITGTLTTGYIPKASGTSSLSDSLIYNNATSIGINTSSPNSSALLHLNSNTKGFLPPSMTSDEIMAITSPANALMVYKTDAYQGIYIYTEDEWCPILTGNEAISFTGTQGTNGVNGPFQSRSSGTGASPFAGTWSNGFKNVNINIVTGTTATGIGGIMSQQNSGMSTGGEICFRFYVSIPILSNITETFSVTIGNGTDPLSGYQNGNFGFSYRYDINGGNWTGYRNAGAASIDLGIPVVAGTRYILEIEYISSVSLKYYINGILRGTISSSVPSSTSGSYLMGAGIAKTVGTTTRSFYISQILVKKVKY